MMAFSTRPIRLTPFRLFKILLRQHFRRRPWLLLVYGLVFVGYYVLSTNLVDSIFWVRAIGSGVLLAVLLYPPVLYWRTVNLPENRSFYLPRIYTFSGDTIATHIRDQKLSENLWEVTHRLENLKDHYLLFLSPSQFFYIPKTAFQSEQDHHAFQQLLWEWQLVEKAPAELAG